MNIVNQTPVIRFLIISASTDPFQIYLYLLSGLSQLLAQSFLILFYVIFIVVEVASSQHKFQAAFKGNDKAYDYAARVFSSLKDFLVIKTNINLITGAAVVSPCGY